jgi:hypothetical protein
LAEFSMHIHILDDGIAAAFELADDLATDFMRAHKPRAREKGVAEASNEPDLANDEHYEPFPAESAEQWRQDELMRKEGDDWLTYWWTHEAIAHSDKFPEELPQGDDERMHTLSAGAPSALTICPCCRLHSLPAFFHRLVRVVGEPLTISTPPHSLPQGRTVTAGSTRRNPTSRSRGRYS